MDAEVVRQHIMAERPRADPWLTSVFGEEPASPVSSVQDGNRSHSLSVGADPHRGNVGHGC